MEALGLALFVGLALIVAYNTYGRWIARRVFMLREDAATPAVVFNDNRDYCPTRRSVVFGHHFTSIAGTGPIVGPAIAVMWGWVPAVLWVLIGSIFIGAVHDLGSLVVSLRSKGRSVGDIAGDLLGPRVRLIFLGVLVLALWIVLAIFGLVVVAVLRQYPMAIFPVLVQIPLAVAIGLFIHRQGRSLVIPSIVALALMYASVIWGDTGWLHDFNTTLADQPRWAWVIGLLGYCYIASVLPVWVLLQPRDYINALQLISALGLLVVGLVAAALWGGVIDAPSAAEGAQAAGVAATAMERIPLEIVAPTVNWHPEGAPPMIPLLFITIACGAISGFHCLVSSGTTSKQLKNESDAHAVGYGSMLTEGFLATLVIISCAAGIGLGVMKPNDSVRSGGVGDFGTVLVRKVLIPASDDSQIVFATAYRNRGDTVSLPLAESPKGPVDETASLRVAGKVAVHGFGLGDEGEVLTVIDGEALPYATVLRNEDSTGWHVFEDGRVRATDDGASYVVAGGLAFSKQYESWAAAGSLAAMVGAFVDGSANLVKSIGVPAGVAVALMGVMVASFAGTTMDTACRLQRYVIQELSRTFLPRPVPNSCRACGYSLAGLAKDTNCPECNDANAWRLDFGGHPEELDAPALERDLIERHASPWNPCRWLATRHGATSLAVVSAILLACIPAPGQNWSLANAGAGGLILWPMFGATNQLLGGLAFIVIAVWLIATKRPWWFVAIPAALMLILPAWALAWQAYVGNDGTPSWLDNGDWALLLVATFMLAMEAWLVVEVALRARAGRINEALLRGITTDDARAERAPVC